MHFIKYDSFDYSEQASKRRLRCGVALAAVIVVCGYSNAVLAQTRTWDGDPATAGLQGVSGDWDFATQNWHNPANNPSLYIDGLPVQFTTAAGPVTVTITEPTVSPFSMSFEVSGYEITGGTIDQFGVFDLDISLDAGVTATISSDLDGNFAVSGSGALTYSGDGSAVTAMTVNSGATLNVSGSIGSTLTNEGTVVNTGTLDTVVNNGGDFTSSASVTGDITDTDGSLTLSGTVDGDISTDGGTIAITGPLTSFGNNSLTVTGSAANGAGLATVGGGLNADELAVSGSSAVNNGTIDLNASTSVEDVTFGAFGVLNNNVGTLTVSNDIDVVADATLLNSDVLSGTVIVQTDGTFTSTGEVDGDVENRGGDTTLSGLVSGGGAVTNFGGNLDVAAAGLNTSGGDFSVQADGTAGNAATTIAGDLTAGELTVSGSAGFTGAVDITAGTTNVSDVIFGAGGSLSNAGILTSGDSIGVVDQSSLNNTGTVNSDVTVATGGVFASSNIVNGEVRNNGGTVTLSGQVNGAGGVDLRGGITEITAAGLDVAAGNVELVATTAATVLNINGDLTTNTLSIDGSGTDAATVELANGFSYTGALDLSSGGILNASGDLILDSTAVVEGDSELNILGVGTMNVGVQVDEDGEFSQATNYQNTATTQMVNEGTVTANVDVQAGSVLESTGVITGDVTNIAATSQSDLAGTITGSVFNQAGIVNVTDDLSVSAQFDNDAQLNVLNGSLSADVLDNAGTINLGSGEAITATTSFTNEATGVLEAQGGSIVGNLTNDGTLNLAADLGVQGSLTNNLDIFHTAAAGVTTTVTVTNVFDNFATVNANGEAIVINADTATLRATSMLIGNVQINAANTIDYGTRNFNVDQALGGNYTMGSPTGDATISAELDAAGFNFTNQNNTDITPTGSIINGGTVTNTGVGATFDVANGGSITATDIVNEASGIFTNNGTLYGAVSNDNADFISTNQINGTFSNTTGATAALTGQIDGDLVNEAGSTVTVDTASGLHVTGTTDNDGLLQVMTGDLQADGQITNNGTLDIDAGRTLTSAATVLNAQAAGPAPAGVIQNDGVIDANVTNETGASIVTTNDITGTLSSEGDVDAQGTIGAVDALAGTFELTGDLSVDGLFNNDVTLDVTAFNLSSDTMTTSGAVDVGGGMVLTATNGVTVENGGSLTNTASQVSGDVLVQTGGQLTSTGTITGDIDTSDTTDLEGTIGDLIVRDGTTTVTAALAADATQVLADGDFDVTGGVLTADSFENSGDTDVTTGITAATIDNIGTGDLNNSGTLTGAVTNGQNAALTSSNVIAGTLSNDGAAFIGGTTGATENLDNGVFNLTGNLTTGASQFTNSGQLIIDAGETLTTSQLNNTGTVTLDGDLAAVLNNGGAGIVNTANHTFANAVSSNGRINSSAGDLAFNGGLSGNGTVSTVDGNITDEITIAGGLSGGHTFDLDIDLSASDGLNRTDFITVTGGATTGHVVLNFAEISGTVGPQGNDILVLDADDGFGNSYSFSTTGLGVPSETVTQIAQKIGGNDLYIVNVVNPGITAAAGNVILTQSLIGALVNRPSSPFVTGLAYEDPDPCGAGAWVRAIGGGAQVDGSTTTKSTTGDFTVPSELSANFYGLQGGADFACFNGIGGGWDFSLGAIAGFNRGSSSQPVYAIDPDDPSVASDILTSTTSSDFNQFYGGIYGTAARGPLAFDLQYRYEVTNFEISNRPESGFVGLGLDREEYSSRASTISGAVSYGFPIGETGLAVVPTLGFAVAQIDTDPIDFSDGGQLRVDRTTTAFGFAGATVSKTTFGDDDVSLLNRFITATVYNDFASAPTSVYEDSIGTEFELESENLGTYGELSAGLNYVRILNPGQWGAAKQFNASVRGDVRLSEKVTSWGLTAQLRVQF